MNQKTKKDLIGAILFLVVFSLALMFFNHWSYWEKIVSQLFK